MRFRAIPTYPLVLLVAVTDDNPAGGPFYGTTSPAVRNASGTRFDLSTGVFIIAEAQFSVDAARRLGADHAMLPGTWTVGGFYDTGAFPDRRYDDRGQLLASPTSTGVPLMHRGNWMVYAVADQTVWRTDETTPRAASLFFRISATDGSRNTFPWQPMPG